MTMLRPNGSRIAELRKQKSLTQSDCKIDAKTLRKIERGEPTRAQAMRRLAEVLRVPLEAIVHADDVGAVRELDVFRATIRKGTKDDVILIDQHAHSPTKKMLELEPIEEGRFVDTIRAVEVLKWHVDLVHPSDDKLDYLREVAQLVDHFRMFVKGLGGLEIMNPHRTQSLKHTKERDHSFTDALSQQRDAIKLRDLVSGSKQYGLRFLWVFYTFWGIDRDWAGQEFPEEQEVTLVVATDSERAKVFAMVPTGTSPYDDTTTKGETEIVPIYSSSDKSPGEQSATSAVKLKDDDEV